MVPCEEVFDVLLQGEALNRKRFPIYLTSDLKQIFLDTQHEIPVKLSSSVAVISFLSSLYKYHSIIMQEMLRENNLLQVH